MPLVPSKQDIEQDFGPLAEEVLNTHTGNLLTPNYAPGCTER